MIDIFIVHVQTGVIQSTNFTLYHCIAQFMYMYIVHVCVEEWMKMNMQLIYYMYMCVCQKSDPCPSTFTPSFCFCEGLKATSLKVYNCLPTPPRSSINRPAGVIG